MTATTILIVDDDEPTRVAYAALLADSGYQVLQASHGGEAILHVHLHKPEVMLMDLLMPVLDRVQRAEALRKVALTANTRILGITAETGASQEHMRQLCDDLLVKPCSAEEILGRLAALATTPA